MLTTIRTLKDSVFSVHRQPSGRQWSPFIVVYTVSHVSETCIMQCVKMKQSLVDHILNSVTGLGWRCTKLGAPCRILQIHFCFCLILYVSRRSPVVYICVCHPYIIDLCVCFSYILYIGCFSSACVCYCVRRSLVDYVPVCNHLHY